MSRHRPEIRLKRLARYQRSSLFGLFVSDEEKKNSYIILTSAVAAAKKSKGAFKVEAEEISVADVTDILPATDVTDIPPAIDITDVPAASGDTGALPAKDDTAETAEEAEYVPGSPYDDVFEELERSSSDKNNSG